MLPHSNLNYTGATKACLAVAILGAILMLASLLAGKTALFLLLNGDGGIIIDQFFSAITNFGDGAIWISWFVYFIFFGKKRLLPALTASLVFSTIFSQVPKKIFDEPRPLKAIVDQLTVHYVKGVEVHSYNSFPSGHTATAFAFALLCTLLFPKKIVIWVAFLMAVLVGYSRIYLGQHFPLDVGGGMVAAAGSVLLAMTFQQYFDQKTPGV